MAIAWNGVAAGDSSAIKRSAGTPAHISENNHRIRFSMMLRFSFHLKIPTPFAAREFRIPAGCCATTSHLLLPHVHSRTVPSADRTQATDRQHIRIPRPEYWAVSWLMICSAMSISCLSLKNQFPNGPATLQSYPNISVEYTGMLVP